MSVLLDFLICQDEPPDVHAKGIRSLVLGLHTHACWLVSLARAVVQWMVLQDDLRAPNTVFTLTGCRIALRATP
jgi:hypothetical protein